MIRVQAQRQHAQGAEERSASRHGDQDRGGERAAREQCSPEPDEERMPSERLKRP